MVNNQSLTLVFTMINNTSADQFKAYDNKIQLAKVTSLDNISLQDMRKYC